MSTTINNTDASYLSYVDSMSLPNGSLFKTNAPLWDIYLNSFSSEEAKQHYNCNTCKSFIRRYGNLVTINDDGTTTSALWDPAKAPEEIRNAVGEMKHHAEVAKVVGVFVSSLKTLGVRENGLPDACYHHYHVANPNPTPKWRESDGEAMARKLEDFRTLSSALAGYRVDVLEKAFALASSNALYRSEKVLGHAEWLLHLKKATSSRPAVASNLIWKAVSTAPAGFCTPRSSVLGSLLDDLGNGLSVADATNRFAEKLHPLRYRRPTAAPTDGAIDAAEKLVEKLGVARSLERRYATIEDIEKLWWPSEGNIGDSSVFGHLKNSNPDTSSVNRGNITWVKFAADVLPRAKSIEVYIPHGLSDYTVFTSATHFDAPLIFQWDNPVSWYHWHGGCLPGFMGLKPGWAKCKAVCLYPHMWGGNKRANFDSNMSFIIEGAYEQPHMGISLFPEALKAELHGIRKVVERHSATSKLTGEGAPHVIGKGVGSRVRVDIGVTVEYTIDRWE